VDRGTLTQGIMPRSSSTTSTTMDADLSSSPNSGAVDALELRQLNIIDKLSKLRDMITNIHEKCVGSVAGCSSTAAVSSVPENDKHVLPEENIELEWAKDNLINFLNV